MMGLTKTQKHWAALAGAVVFGVCFGAFVPHKPCPPCPEAVTDNGFWTPWDTVPVSVEVGWQPYDTTKEAWAVGTYDTAFPIVAATVPDKIKQGDYVETQQGIRGYVQWEVGSSGVYQVRMAGCCEPVTIGGEYLELVEEP